jgi:hypothetical protein
VDTISVAFISVIRIVLLMSGVLEDSVGRFAIVILNVVLNRSVKTDCVM